jgi:hypothetical protein
MSDEDKESKKKEGFFSSIAAKIVGAVILLAVTGALGYFIASIKSGLDKIGQISDRLIAVETIIKESLPKSIDSLRDATRDQGSQFGSVFADLKKFELEQARMDERLKSLERDK